MPTAVLSFAELFGADLSGANLSDADLTSALLFDAVLAGTKAIRVNLTEARLAGAALDEADLRGTNLTGASLIEANLGSAKLSDVTTVGANFSQVNFTRTDLRRSNLRGSQLFAAIFVQTDLRQADLSSSLVYGIGALDLVLDEETNQADLKVTPGGSVTVDDLEVAQFVYLMLNNEKIRNVLTTIGEKGVLILGRFTPERKLVLDALRERLRELNYVPMMFDFEKADDRSFTETIKILAGLSRFVIVDVTNPKCAPLELQATVPNYMVLFIPIIQQGEEPFSMLDDLQQYGWVMALKEYRSIDQLLEKLESRIIEPTLKLHAELQLKKAQGIQRES